MVARQATEQIMDLRYTIRMLGIPIDGPAWMFGDNKSVIMSSTIPQSKLNKRHNALSFHRVRSAVASKILYFLHIEGVNNPSDICTKFLSRAKFWPICAPLLFWTNAQLEKGKTELLLSKLIMEVTDQEELDYHDHSMEDGEYMVPPIHKDWTYEKPED
jgi:hypothetical protein